MLTNSDSVELSVSIFCSSLIRSCVKHPTKKSTIPPHFVRSSSNCSLIFFQSWAKINRVQSFFWGLLLTVEAQLKPNHWKQSFSRKHRKVKQNWNLQQRFCLENTPRNISVWILHVSLESYECKLKECRLTLLTSCDLKQYAYCSLYLLKWPRTQPAGWLHQTKTVCYMSCPKKKHIQTKCLDSFSVQRVCSLFAKWLALMTKIVQYLIFN